MTHARPTAAMRSAWRVVDARFIRSAPGLEAAPPPVHPEIAVAGRSNVGKSSLLNRVAGRTGLARVSGTPGRTRLLNFFELEVRARDRACTLSWVDLPGYGWARAAASIRESFGPMIEGYVRGRSSLCGVLLLVDLRRGITPDDVELVEWLRACERDVWVCGTKADKLASHARVRACRDVARALGLAHQDVLATSATTGLGLGEGPGTPSALASFLLARIDAERGAAAQAPPEGATERGGEGEGA